jgi:hypothetical protein
MSEPRYNTGSKRSIECEKCGRMVTQSESLGMYGDGPHWMTDQHDASCGRPCWGAGVPAKAYREKQLHGFPDYPCSGCEVTHG